MCESPTCGSGSILGRIAETAIHSSWEEQDTVSSAQTCDQDEMYQEDSNDLAKDLRRHPSVEARCLLCDTAKDMLTCSRKGQTKALDPCSCPFSPRDPPNAKLEQDLE
jgi:hypothetical protein